VHRWNGKWAGRQGAAAFAGFQKKLTGTGKTKANRKRVGIRKHSQTPLYVQWLRFACRVEKYFSPMLMF
jgi:hypothetical protein